MMRGAVSWRVGLVLVALGFGLLTQSSCSTVERQASADEVVVVPREALAQSCDIGTMNTVALCGGAASSCHICARVESVDIVLAGQCMQACTVGGDECGGGERCHPISELIEGGVARMGDCPTGYCR